MRMIWLFLLMLYGLNLDVVFECTVCIWKKYHDDDDDNDDDIFFKKFTLYQG